MIILDKRVATLASAIAMSLIVQGAFAVDSGKVTFEGGVSDTTCDVSVNDQTNNATVKLPIVSKKLLTAAGSSAGRTFLTFELKNCVVDNAAGQPSQPGAVVAPKAHVYFVAGPTINTDGRLDNKALTGAAQNVDIQILNKDAAAMNLALGDGAQLAIGENVVGGSAILRHYAQYFTKAGNATAGAVTTTVDYEISYQ
ncbi:fimbrial protein [Pseudomonas sp. GV071]|jgi:major type 1 subunit fimbrin (pilin)|uniref:fimbrial protein n=1 Tax=Pseudomonas sp. GV071 TaxID=2135754 RepID=UPI000D4377EF|nr:fimbrial protein [Pseudomonas sp. GV071]PTQ72908.1 major type 1 subunit fimbrin (pilin) [Pseudomonas sp. GV071]